MSILTVRLTTVYTVYTTRIAETLRRQAGELTREHIEQARDIALQIMGRLEGRMRELLEHDPTMSERDRFMTAKSETDAEVSTLLAPPAT